jgi:hypothetical protein
MRPRRRPQHSPWIQRRILLLPPLHTTPPAAAGSCNVTTRSSNRKVTTRAALRLQIKVAVEVVVLTDGRLAGDGEAVVVARFLERVVLAAAGAVSQAVE